MLSLGVVLLATTLSTVAPDGPAPPPGPVIVPTLALGAPTLHFVNHHVAAGVGSLVVRGLFVGLIYSLLQPSQTDCSMSQSPGACGLSQVGGAFVEAGLVGGLAIGGLLFALVDDMLLARRYEMQPLVAEPPRRVTIAPNIFAGAGGAQLGVVGRF